MTSVANNTSTKDSDEIDFGRLIGELIDHRKLILCITTTCTVLGLVYALFATPVYQATALIQVEQKQGNAILNNLSEMLPGSQPISAPEIALLQSRMILGKTVDDLNLQAVVEQNYFPLFGRGWARETGEKSSNVNISRLYIPDAFLKNSLLNLKIKVIDKKNYEISGEGVSFKGKVGVLVQSNGITVKIDEIDASNGQEFNVKYVTRLKAINELSKSFSVSDQGKDTGMLNLSITDTNPLRASLILDDISQNYLAQNISRQAAQDAKSLDFLNEQLPQVRTDLNNAEDKLNHYRQEKDSVDLSLEAKAVLDQIVNVENQLNELTFRESEISQLYTKEHPTYKALLEKKQTLLDEKNKLNKKVSAMPETQQEVLRLSRDVESGRTVYIQLLNRQQELNIAKSSAIGYVRIVDTAVTQPKPVKPQKAIIVIISFILGLLISICVVLLRIFLRRGIESPQQLEDIGINVYASIPISETLTKKINIEKLSRIKSQLTNKSYLAVENPADIAIEAIRGLRTSLHFAMMEAQNKILMISGASPDVGKTFISSNLAAVVAQSGKKVLFIDTDMRKGYIHKIFEVSNDSGLSEILSGKIKIHDAVKCIPNVGFDFISRGIVPPNPAELLMHSHFSELMKWANENYDLVIIDTPPILAVTDAAIIGAYAGTTLLVARFEYNTPKEIAASIKRLELSGVAVKGCILNAVVKKASGYYGYGYDSYGYTYKDSSN